MSLLREYFSLLLIEGKVEDLQKKYPKLDIKDISNNDPSKTNKYLEWMAKQIDAGAKKEDLYPTIALFHKNINQLEKRDINSYKTAKELEDAVKNIGLSKRKEIKQVKSGAPKIYEDDNVVVLRPDTKNACVTYGKGTRWCITMQDASYYEQYVGSNVVFYFIFRKEQRLNDSDKIAIVVQRDADNNIAQFEGYYADDAQMDEYALEHNFEVWYGENKNNWVKIKSVIINDAKKQPKAFLARVKSNDNWTIEEFKDYWKSISNEEGSIEAKNILLDTILESSDEKKKQEIAVWLSENEKIILDSRIGFLKKLLELNPDLGEKYVDTLTPESKRGISFIILKHTLLSNKKSILEKALNKVIELNLFETSVLYDLLTSGIKNSNVAYEVVKEKLDKLLAYGTAQTITYILYSPLIKPATEIIFSKEFQDNFGSKITESSYHDLFSVMMGMGSFPGFSGEAIEELVKKHFDVMKEMNSATVRYRLIEYAPKERLPELLDDKTAKHSSFILSFIGRVTDEQLGWLLNYKPLVNMIESRPEAAWYGRDNDLNEAILVRILDNREDLLDKFLSLFSIKTQERLKQYIEAYNRRKEQNK